MILIRIKKIFFTTCVCCFFLNLLSCSQYESSQSFKNTLACKNNSFLQAYHCSLESIQHAARSGDPDAKYALGYLYYYGIGTIQDTSIAESWINRAALAGQPLALQAKALIAKANIQVEKTNTQELMAQSRQTTTQYSLLAQAPDHLTTVANIKSNQPLTSKKNHFHPISLVNQDATLPKYHAASIARGQIFHAKNKAPVHQSPAEKKPERYLAMNHRPGSKQRENKRIVSVSVSTSPYSRGSHSHSPLTARLIQDELYLLATSKRYTIQLLSGSHYPAIHQLIHRYHLGSKAHCVRASRGGKIRYILLYGNYLTHSEASLEKHRLSKSLKSMKPWIKSMGIVKKEVPV